MDKEIKGAERAYYSVATFITIIIVLGSVTLNLIRPEWLA
jgi:hypothetical protein